MNNNNLNYEMLPPMPLLSITTAKELNNCKNFTDHELLKTIFIASYPKSG